MISSPRGVAWVVVAASPLAAALYGCFVVDGLRVPPAPLDATPDTAPPTVADDGCKHANIPPQPAGPDGTEAPLVFALDSITFENRDKNAAPIGFDLDGTCTCENEAPDTCVTKSGQPKCDTEGGVDNATTELTSTLPPQLSVQTSMNDLLQDGRGGLVFRVDGYNHGKDDKNVSVYFFPSRGTWRKLPDAGAEHVPKADAGGVWSYDPEWGRQNGSFSTLGSIGWVKDYVLVAPFVGRMPIAGLEIELRSGYFVVELEPETLRVKRGLLVGRWPVAGVGRAVGGFKVGSLFGPDSGSEPLCRQPEFWALVTRDMCDRTDIMANSDDDKQGKRCDAISFGISFMASPATTGDEVSLVKLETCSDLPALECK